MPTTTQALTDLRPGEAVTSARLRAWLVTGESPRVLDVRTPAEYECAHIPGAYNVPLDTLREGGMLRWESDGAPVNRGRQRWDLDTILSQLGADASADR